ncbi:MAG TPA: UDP-3-O-(3-hydroxymyristoyl)glucosamine N-acyltransferase [Thermoanaerobaculia bacterium]|nr:UDP-3-O-(3-hydroxymyristoyl)glucosamine N-acyltransferase [Thermoanaerobaculia bacterium]
MPFRLGELAELVGGRVRGDADRLIHRVRSLAAAGPEDLSLVADRRYLAAARSSRAGALLVRSEEPGLSHDLLLSDDPGWALAPLLAAFHPPVQPAPGVHPTAVVGPGCAIDSTAHLGPQVVVGEESRIEAGAVLHPGVVVGRRCRVGAGTVLHPRAVLYDDTELGARVIVHAGAVLGADGFGYASRGGRMVKVPQVGRLVIEEDVEIGANSAVDRATLEETRVGAGSKLDNLVQVGHNVRLGAGCVLCGQVGIAGSTRLGAGVVVGGRGGVAGHLEVGDGVQVAATAVVFGDVPAGRKVGGIPAIDLAEWRRLTVRLARLGELFRRVRRLEKEQRGGSLD